MEEINYSTKLKELRNKVMNGSGKMFKLPVINTKSPFFYVAIVLFIFIILALSRPSFVLYEHTDEENNITFKLHFKKLMIATLILGSVTSIGIFAYFK